MKCTYGPKYIRMLIKHIPTGVYFTQKHSSDSYYRYTSNNITKVINATNGTLGFVPHERALGIVRRHNYIREGMVFFMNSGIDVCSCQHHDTYDEIFLLNEMAAFNASRPHITGTLARSLYIRVLNDKRRRYCSSLNGQQEF